MVKSDLSGNSRGRLLNVPVALVNSFFSEYAFHPESRELNSTLILAYIAEQQRGGALGYWNVVISGHGSAPLGTWITTLGAIGFVNRSKLPQSQDARLNIKTLFSKQDLLSDLDNTPEDIAALSIGGLLARRRQLLPGQPLLVIYPVHRNSSPRRQTGGRSPVRVALNAHDHVIGVAVVWPGVENHTPQNYKVINLGPLPEEPDYNEDEEDEIAAPLT